MSIRSNRRARALGALLAAAALGCSSSPSSPAPEGRDDVPATPDDLGAGSDALELPEVAKDVSATRDVPSTDDVPLATDVPPTEDVPATENCGSANDPCCASGAACGGALVCASGRCARCGGAGQPCCADEACGNDLSCMGGTCMATPSCGGRGEPCCARSRCNDSLSCSGSRCTSCGGAGETCCPDPSTGNLSVCNGRLGCRSSDMTCVAPAGCTTVAEGGACGASGLCCAAGTVCGSRDGTSQTCLAESCATLRGQDCTPGDTNCCQDGAHCAMSARGTNSCCLPVGGACGSERGCCEVAGNTIDCDAHQHRCCVEEGPCGSSADCCGTRQCMGGRCRFP